MIECCADGFHASAAGPAPQALPTIAELAAGTNGTDWPSVIARCVGLWASGPHESACHCGAYGGHTGDVSARLLAQLLNDPETRAGLAGRGIDLANDTLFIAVLHDTTTDNTTLFAEAAPRSHAEDLRLAKD